MLNRNQRNSNLEILRIIAMFFIIAHHFAVHGMGNIDFVASNPNNYIIFFCGILGKIGVVVFVLISAYFMINSKFTLRKLLVLGGEVYFYSVIFLLIFKIFLPPVEPITLENIGIYLLPISHSAYWFVTAYIVLMLLSPFLNKFIKSLSKKNFIRLLLLCIVLWSIFPTFTPTFMDAGAPMFVGYSFQFVPILWFVVLYFIGSFIRLHFDIDKLSFKKLIAIFSLSMIITYVASCIIGYYDIIYPLSQNLHMWVGYPIEAVDDGILYMAPALENKLFVLIASTTLFLIFLKRKEFSNKYINYIAGSAFGVYLIHDNLIVRHYLWKTILNTSSYYNSSNLILFAIAALVLIYVACTGIDFIRRWTIEKLWIWIVDNKLNHLPDWIERQLKKFETYLDGYLK